MFKRLLLCLCVCSLTCVVQAQIPFRMMEDLTLAARVHLPEGGETPPVVAGGVVAWGNNDFGQTDVPVAAQSDVINVVANGWDPTSYCLALKSNGDVIGWGNGAEGELTIPEDAQHNVIAIAAGISFAMACRSDGRVVCWGSNSHGQLNVPEAASNSVIDVKCSAHNAMALRSDGSVVTWGENAVATPEAAQSGVVKISCTLNVYFAVKADHTMVVWGSGAAGSPPQTENILDVAGAYNDAMALTTDHTIITWGQDIFGLFSPPQTNNIATLGQQGFYNFSVTTDTGETLVWGYNGGGQNNVPVGAQVDAIGSAVGGYDKGAGYAIIKQ